MRKGRRYRGYSMPCIIIGFGLLLLGIIVYIYEYIQIEQTVETEKIFPTIESKIEWEPLSLPPPEGDSNKNADSIRVVLMDNSYDTIYHNNIKLCSDLEFTLSSGDLSQTVSAGEVLELTEGSVFLANGQIHAQPSKGAELRILSIKRKRGEPTVEGSMDIYKTEKGLVMVNELSLEQYLYRVVPSEMPESYGMEALKAQAVCARSYACRQMQNPGYQEFQADVDDSVSYQVYNNFDKTALTVEAVNQTAGQVAVYEGQVIDAYFFSTSCGHTTDWKVWGEEGEYREYLQGVCVDGCNEKKNLSSEKSFAAFIKGTEQSFESESVWYRWRAKLDFDKLSSKWKEKLGTVQKLIIRERGTGGLIQTLMIEGENNSVDLSTEYEIREFLAGVVKEVILADASEGNSQKLLPSAYFIIEDEDYPEVTLYGGGYGHGAGMSQNAAKKMAQEGWTYDSILTYFYQGIELRNRMEL